MAGMAVVYHRAGDTQVLRRLLGMQASMLDVPGMDYRRDEFVSPNASCVLLNPPRLNARSCVAHDRESGTWLALDGEIHNMDELRFRLDRRGTAMTGEAAADLCLKLYLREGERFVDRLEGQFNLVVYSLPDNTLRLWTDRFGYRPLFVARHGMTLAVASQMKAVLTIFPQAPGLDGVGVLQTLREGIQLGDRTWLEPVKVADPGTLITISPSGERRERYYRLVYGATGATLSRSSYADGFAVRLHRAIDRITAAPGVSCMFLSGGLDSRSAFLAIHPSRLPLRAYSFGGEESRDVSYARKIAELRDVAHKTFKLSPGYLGMVLEKTVWQNEALFPFPWSTSIYFHKEIDPEVDVIITGHCGDVMTGGHLRPYMMGPCSREKLMRRLFASRAMAHDEEIRCVVNPEFHRRHAPLLFEAMRETFTHLEGDHIADVADAWDMENRQRRGTFHSPSVDRYRFTVRTPFLDSELVGYLSAIPPQYRFLQSVYKKMIVSAFPDARNIPWAHTGWPIRTSVMYDFAGMLVNMISNRTRALASRWFARAHGHDRTQARDLGFDIRSDQGLRSTIESFVAAEYFPSEIFDARGILEIVRRHYESGEDHSHVIGCIATYAAAVRLMIYERRERIPDSAVP